MRALSDLNVNAEWIAMGSKHQLGGWRVNYSDKVEPLEMRHCTDGNRQGDVHEVMEVLNAALDLVS